jgi:hypothetical protein
LTTLPFPARLGLVIARAAVLIGVAVLICVPALTRVGQKLETASHTLSFSRNIECPPKKVTVSPAPAAVPAAPIDIAGLAPVARFAPLLAVQPYVPIVAAPRQLRAPPSVLLS